MIAIGIIVWALLIIIIMELTSPGFLIMVFGLIAAYGVLWLTLNYLINRIKNRRK